MYRRPSMAPVSQRFIDLLNVPQEVLRTIAEEKQVIGFASMTVWALAEALDDLPRDELEELTDGFLYAGRTSVTFFRIDEAPKKAEEGAEEAGEKSGDDALVGPTRSFDRKLAAGGEWGRISTVEVVMRPPEVFVRPLSHQEAVKLKRMSTRAEHQATRIRAAILLASNVKTSVPQIARMWLTDESHVRKVIHEFNEEGFDSLRPDYRGGRPRRITPTEAGRV
jgi:hypothetical protein